MLSTSFSCSELGTIELVAPKERKNAQSRNNKHFKSDVSPGRETLDEMRNMARTVAGIETIEPSDRKEATFVIIMKEGISEKQSAQTCIDFMHRFTSYSNRRDRNNATLMSGIGLAVSSEVGAFHGAQGS